MNRFFASALIGLTVLVALPAAAAAQREASIAFPSYGTIRDYRVVDKDTILIRASGKRWYKAELFRPSFDLPFASGIGIADTRGGRFDRFSSIVVRGDRIPLLSLVRVEAPAKKAKRGDA